MRMRRISVLLSTIALAVLLASGVALAMNTIQCKTFTYEGADESCYGTPKRDLMNGTAGKNHMFGKGAADILKGFGSADLLSGDGGNDRLVGGKGFDGLEGFGGDDTLEGGVGDDTYWFWWEPGGIGWGNDAIVDTPTPDDAPHSGNAINFHNDENRGGALVINLSSGPGPEMTIANGTDTVDWTDDAIEDVYNSSTEDDRIVGNEAANTIKTGDFRGGLDGDPNFPDSDTVLGGEGDDRIHVQDASGDDTVECGEDLDGNDIDTVYFDAGDTISPDCEVQNPPQRF
jgi:hypothetical protein